MPRRVPERLHAVIYMPWSPQQGYGSPSPSSSSQNIRDTVPRSYHNPSEESGLEGGGAAYSYHGHMPASAIRSPSDVYPPQFTPDRDANISLPAVTTPREDIRELNYSPITENPGHRLQYGPYPHQIAQTPSPQEGYRERSSLILYGHGHSQLYQSHHQYPPDRQLAFPSEQSAHRSEPEPQWSPSPSISQFSSQSLPLAHRNILGATTSLTRIATSMRYQSFDSPPSSSQSSGLASRHTSPGFLPVGRTGPAVPSMPSSQAPSPSPAPPPDSDQESPAGGQFAPLPSVESDNELADWLRQNTRIPSHQPLSLWSVPEPASGAKPSLPLKWLMALAIYESPERKLTLAEIMAALQDRFPVFRGQGSWKESARHTLSLWKLFKNEPRAVSQPGKGGHWTVVKANSPKRKRKRGAQKGSTKSGAAERDADLYSTPEVDAGPSTQVHGPSYEYTSAASSSQEPPQPAVGPTRPAPYSRISLTTTTSPSHRYYAGYAKPEELRQPRMELQMSFPSAEPSPSSTVTFYHHSIEGHRDEMAGSPTMMRHTMPYEGEECDVQEDEGFHCGLDPPRQLDQDPTGHGKGKGRAF